MHSADPVATLSEAASARAVVRAAIAEGCSWLGGGGGSGAHSAGGGAGAAMWRSWTRRGWGMQHGVERERLWCCCSIFCIGKQEREREREGGRERCPEEKSYGKPQIKIRLMPIL
jgi:hypothetical protein